MIEVQPGLWVSAPLPVKEGDEYKFRLNGNWAVNIGQGGQDGDNFVVNTTGDCIFSLNLNNSSVTCELRSASTYGVIGSICGTYWDTDFPMTEVETDVWRSMPLALKAKDEFKVRMNGSWEYTNYGLDGVMNGQNVVVAQDGVYVVTLDLKAGTLT